MRSKMKTLKLAAFLGAIAVATAGFGFANITASADENDVAQIVGGDSYETLTDAIANATVGDTVELINNIALENTLTIASDKEVTLDLAGYTISYVAQNASASAVIVNNGELTIEDSVGGGLITNKALQPDSVWAPGFPTYANNTINNTGALVIDGGTIENTTQGSGAYYAIDVYPSSNVTINDGKVVCDNNFAIRIFANSTTQDCNLTVNGGEIKGTRALWIQLPQNNSNPVGVNVEVTGGSLIATGYTSGGYFYKNAIYCYSYGNSAEDVNLTVSDGYIEGDIALGGGVKIAPETLTITGGTFDGGVYTYNDNGVDNISVSGGTFNDPYGDVVNYLTDDATVEINGFTYGNIAQVGNQKYKTIQDAIDNTIGNVDITLLGNAVGAGVMIDRAVTINFNGYTYTVDNGVDVNGTSYGFFITKGCSLYNGCIAVDENSGVDVAVLSEATTGEDVSLRFLSINAGNATALVARNAYTYIEGESTIESNSDTVPTILVKDSDSGDRVQLIVKYFEGTPRINGRMDVEGENIVVTLMAGEFNGNICSNDTKNVRVSGGKYATDVAQYVVDGKALEQEGAYFVVVDDNQQGGGNDDGENDSSSGEIERPDGLTDEEWAMILGVLGAIGNTQNGGAQTNDTNVSAPADNTAAVVIAIVAGSLVVLIGAAAVTLWILEKKGIFKISKYFKDEE